MPIIDHDSDGDGGGHGDGDDGIYDDDYNEYEVGRNAQCPFYHLHDGGGDDDDFLTCTIVVVDPPGTGGRRQFSGFPSPRLPRVTWQVQDGLDL